MNLHSCQMWLIGHILSKIERGILDHFLPKKFSYRLHFTNIRAKMLHIVKRKEALSMNSATIAFRVKPEIKRQADELFSRLGMTTSTAMNVLLMQTLEHRGFAAPVVLREENAKRPNETTMRAIEDLDNNRNLSRYDSVGAMLKDVL